MEESELIRCLNTLRRKVRARLVVYGLFAVLSGGVAAFLTILTLDWLLWLPPTLRLLVGVVFVAGFVAAAAHWIVRPIRARLGIDELAARLEVHFDTLRGRLSSAVNFIGRNREEDRKFVSESMMRVVIADAERMVKGLSLDSALSIRPIVLRGGLLVLCTGVLTCIALASPSWPGVGLARYLYPWREIEWPRHVSILPITGDVIAAVGESVTVRMQVQRGLTPDLRGVLHLREPEGPVVSLAMQREQEDAPGAEDDTFYAVIDAITKDLTYWFEAGDDTTARTPHLIRVVRRPQVVEAIAEVEPPPYASDSGVRAQDLSDGPVRAPLGGHVRIMVRASKPIPPDANGTHVGLRTDTGELIPLVSSADPPAPDAADSPATEDLVGGGPRGREELSARFAVAGDVRFRIELRDAEGFENRGAAKYSIVARPDAPPTVAILEPRAVTESTPSGSIPLLIRVEDDFGITQLDLTFEHIGGSTGSLPLTDRLETVQRSESSRADNEGVETVARYLWNVESLSLVPGDVVIYHVLATDNCATPEGTGQIGRSAPMRIKIISDIEFDNRLRSELAILVARIRKVALDQSELSDRIVSLQHSGDDLDLLTDAEHDVVSTLAVHQARLVRRLRELARRFHKTVERMERNHAGNEETRSRIGSVGDELQGIATGPMTDAGGALGRIPELEEPAPQQQRLEETLESQATAVERLQRMLRAMSRWGSFHELLTNTRELLNRQETLRRATTELGRTMLGRAVDTLTEAEAAMLKRVGRQQEQLATDVEQLMARMSRSVTTLEEKDPSGVAAVRAALRTARARDVTRHMRDAATRLDVNRTAAATVSQKAAADTLRGMIASLRERDARQLEELRKRLAQAEEQVALLIEEQKTLRQASHESALMGAEDKTTTSLAQEQRILRRNTAGLGQELAEADRTGAVSAGISSAARRVSEAATPMGQAEALLRKTDAAEATTAQDEALALLQDALARLEETARQTADEALRRSLAQIREDLEEIVAAQRKVNDGIAGLRSAIDKRGRMGRKEARAASRLAREQAAVRVTVDEEIQDFEKVVVFEWALQRIADWMGESRMRLTHRNIDDELIRTTDRIVHELEKLVDAIVETQSLPMDTSFVESADGGGGLGQSADYKAVPTVVELLVLKTMQVDVNDRTKRLGGSVEIAEATEEQLRELRVLGEDQAEVRRLTEMVTNRSRQP